LSETIKHEKRERAVEEIKSILDKLVAETMDKARQVKELQEKVIELSKDMENNWETIQAVRKSLINTPEVYLTPIPFSK
jgi:uncharacterized protein HemX